MEAKADEWILKWSKGVLKISLFLCPFFLCTGSVEVETALALVLCTSMIFSNFGRYFSVTDIIYFGQTFETTNT